MTQEALKLALEKIATVNAMDYEYQAWAREALAQTQEPPFSVQQAYAMAQVCLDIHAELGCAWGDNVYLTISRLKASPPQRTWVGLTAEQMLECNMDGDWTTDRETAKLNVQAKLKELNT